MAKGIVRKNYLKGSKTLTYAAGGTDNIVLSGQFNQINFGLRGQTQTAGGGAVVGKGALNYIDRMKIVSTKHGTVVDFNGSDLYQISRVFFGSGAFTNATTGATTDNVGFEAALPLSCDHDESLTIFVTWCGLLEVVDDATGYTGVLRVNAELLPHNPETKWAWMAQVVGANGVIGVNTRWPQPTIPQVGPGFDLGCCVIQTMKTDASTYADALEDITLQQGVGNYIMDDDAPLLKHTFNILVPIANIAGVYGLKWFPFDHTAETILTLGNGAVATFAGSRVVYGYPMRLSEKQGYAEEPGMVPSEPPTAPVIQAPIGAEQTAQGYKRFGGIMEGLNVPARRLYRK